jgi:phosphoribosylformylglycinamidine cyclo-ligase
LPEKLAFRVQAGWPVPPVFRWLAATGPVDEPEMLRTFNMGIGMTAVVDKSDVDKAIACLAKAGVAAYRIGEVIEAVPGKPRVLIEGQV